MDEYDRMLLWTGDERMMKIPDYFEWIEWAIRQEEEMGRKVDTVYVDTSTYQQIERLMNYKLKEVDVKDGSHPNKMVYKGVYIQKINKQNRGGTKRRIGGGIDEYKYK